MKAATPIWPDPHAPYAPKNVLDGNLDRKQEDGSCYHAQQVDARPAGAKTPYLNLTLADEMKLSRVEVVPRATGPATDPVWGVIALKVLACETESECSECQMENKAALQPSTESVIYNCKGASTNLLVLTNEPTAYVIACEVMAYGYSSM